MPGGVANHRGFAVQVLQDTCGVDMSNYDGKVIHNAFFLLQFVEQGIS
jgi:hypothetical protein